MNLIGIDIGGTKCAVILGQIKEGGNIDVLDKIQFVTADFPGPLEMLPQLKNGISEIAKKHKLQIKDISSIGISCGGPLDSKKGIVLGSIYVRTSHLLIPSLQKSLEKESLPPARKVCRIVPAELDEKIGDIASLSVAADNSK
jgi:predicted NBD/HSP70 family sugar kinase